MRITNQMAYNTVTSSILRNRSAAYDAQEQISSGKQISRPSDDPVAYESLARLRDDLAAVERRTGNVAKAQLELTTVDGAMQDVVDILQRVHEIAILASGGTPYTTELKALGEEVDAYVNGLVSAANTPFEGHALFGGLQGGKTAYEPRDNDGDGRTDAVAYQGDSGTRKVEVGNGTYVNVNIVGSDPTSSHAAFESDTVNLFDTIIQFRDRLLAGDSIVETDTVKQLQDCQEHILGVQGVVGGRAESLKFHGASLSNREKDVQNAIDGTESVDVAKAAMDLAGKQQAYEAALRSATTLWQNSLLDLLG